MSPCELSLTKTQMERTNNPYDIMVGILSRLPANSLLRLRWACKYLFDLITRDDDFIKLHLHRSTTTSDHDSSVLSSASFSKSNGYNFQCYLNYTTCSFSCCKHNRACPLESSNEHVKLITCINGLLFFRIEHDLDSTFCIWNPCTNEYRVLSVPVPDPPMLIKNKKRCLGRYGFGYDHTINDYKVVRNDYYYNGASDVQIYTLGTNSWRSIGPVPVQYKQPPQPYWEGLGGVFVNGALHWLLDPLGNKIVSFDIGKEEYKEVLIEQLHPKILPRGTYERTMELQVFEGSLCCLVAQHTNNSAAKHKHHFVMWKMKDYDVNNNKYSWTKLFETSTDKYRRLTLLRLTQDGEILMLEGINLVVYDPNHGTSRIVSKICEEKKCYHVIDAVYTESLVSLNSGTYYTGRLKNLKRKNEQR